jgi:hypothetical protein
MRGRRDDFAPSLSPHSFTTYSPPTSGGTKPSPVEGPARENPAACASGQAPTPSGCVLGCAVTGSARHVSNRRPFRGPLALTSSSHTAPTSGGTNTCHHVFVRTRLTSSSRVIRRPCQAARNHKVYAAHDSYAAHFGGGEHVARPLPLVHGPRPVRQVLEGVPV